MTIRTVLLSIFFCLTASLGYTQVRWNAISLDWNEVSVGSEEQTGFSLGWAYTDARSLSGLQLGTLFDRTIEDSLGFQMSLGSTLNEASFTGLSVSGFYNSTKGTVGAQIAPFGWNLDTARVNGLQIGFIGNYSMGAVSLAQIGGLNIQHDDSSGGQVGLISISDNLNGVQADLLGSFARGNVKGGQIGLVTWGENTTGFQVGGLNHSNNISGVQLGLVNIADTVYGTQIGLVNIVREMHGVPIGLFDFVANGNNRFVYSLELPLRWDLDEQSHSFGYRFGSTNIYKEVAVTIGSGSERRWFSLYGASLRLGVRSSLIDDLLGMTGDVGVGLGNREETIEILPGRTFVEHIEYQTRQAIEVEVVDLFGLQIGFSQRYVVDPWTNIGVPPNSFHLVKTPHWNLYIVNSLLLGLQY